MTFLFKSVTLESNQKHFDMGSYHKNLTDKAVLDRVRTASKNNPQEVVFYVHKAKKKFKITVMSPLQTQKIQTQIYDSPSGQFTIEECAYKK